MVAERIWDKLISEKVCCGNKVSKICLVGWVVVTVDDMLVGMVTGQMKAKGEVSSSRSL